MKRHQVPTGVSARGAVPLFCLVVLLALTSCSSFGGAEASADYEDFGYLKAGEGLASPAADSAPRERSAPATAAALGSGPGGLADVETEAPEPGESETSEPLARLRVYSADLELSVASVAESRAAIIGMVEGAGGYVESSRADALVVRVPAAKFDAILATIETVGEVRSRAVSTADVTDQFFDIERRLRISESSRERLLRLLEETEDPEERVLILRDIRRLTEEIELLRSSLESLDQLIRFSRITITLISRIELSRIGRQEIPFWWIAALEPLGSTTWPAAADIDITPDETFAVFRTGRQLFAEAADGTQLRGGAVANEPRGSSEFWQAALAYHLAPYYRSVERIEAGGYRGVVLESKDAAPFYYLILVQPRGDEIVVAEAFIPNEEARDSRLATILAAIDGGAE